MPLKKRTYDADEIAIYDEAVIYKRGEYWQFRMWLAKESKYARFSLRTRSQSTAQDLAKKHFHEIKAAELNGKRYYSLTTKAGVALYLEQRKKDVDAGLIVSGRYTTIRTHLEHWLEFIGRDTKLKELQRTDCENYFHTRTKTKNNSRISQTTVANEQCTINAMMLWLYKRKEAYIDGFDFTKLKRIDRGDEELRRATFTDKEIEQFSAALEVYVKSALADLSNEANLVKAICSYYFGVAMISGLRRGEQLQMRWSDISELEHEVTKKHKFDLVKIVVRAETSKVRKTRKLAVRDPFYFSGMLKLAMRIHGIKNVSGVLVALGDNLIFSTDGKAAITARAIAYHFDKLIEAAKINTRNRSIVPYSFRHYFITQRVNSNLPPIAVAEMCGTSVAQIDKTYYHTTQEKMISNALADYEIRDGIYVPKVY